MKKRFVNDMDRELYTVLDPQYGYLNADGEPTMLDEGLGQGVTHGHDMENAVFFDADDAFDLVSRWDIDKDRVVITQYTPKDINESIPFKINTHREYESSPIPQHTQRDVQNQSRTDTGQYVVFNPAYGYLNENAEYKSFNVQDAAMYTDSDMEKLGLDDKELIKQPLTTKQQNALKLSIGALPDVQTEKLLDTHKGVRHPYTYLEEHNGVRHLYRYPRPDPADRRDLKDVINQAIREVGHPDKPEFDFADFGKGLDDLDTDEPTQRQ